MTPVIYIAGPYRGDTAWDIAENVRAAERVALAVAAAGAIPLCPHTMYAHFHGQLTEEFWVAAALELLERSDAAVFIPGWRRSTGSRGEWDACEDVGLPAFDLGPVCESGVLFGWSPFAEWVQRELARAA